MSSRPPGKLIMLPSAQRHWQQQRLRKRRVKVVVAGVGLLGLLVALVDVTMEAGSMPTPVGQTAQVKGEEPEETVEDSAPHPSAGRTSREPDLQPAWLSNTGSD